jgi:hypothetical protein
MFAALTATAAVAAGGLATHPVQAQDGPGAAAPGPRPTFTLDAVERAAGWEVLFDGTSTDAFRTFRSPDFNEGPWRIDADGCLVTSGGGGDIITRRQFGNFELVLEWSAGPGGNSGIMYRVTEEQSATYLTGPEYQILDDAGYGDGVAPDANFSAGALYALATPPADKILRPAGEFNEARIRLMNGWVTHWLNGVKVAEMNLDGAEFDAAVAASKFADMPGFGQAQVGHLALQAHGDPIRFRNIRVRDFDADWWAASDLLRDENWRPSLDRWTYHLNAPAAMSDVWTLEDGVLQCAGRPIGYIRTRDDHQDFVLQLEWRFDPARGAGNSGVLVRMVGEDTVWPKSVEAQLQSGRAGDFWNIDEFAMTVPAERTNGRNTRHLFANERPLGAWNHYEIIVSGGDVRLRVNGEELNAATDVARVPGKICLQSEGAYIEFRNIRLRPIHTW